MSSSSQLLLSPTLITPHTRSEGLYCDIRRSDIPWVTFSADVVQEWLGRATPPAE